MPTNAASENAPGGSNFISKLGDEFSNLFTHLSRTYAFAGTVFEEKQGFWRVFRERDGSNFPRFFIRANIKSSVKLRPFRKECNGQEFSFLDNAGCVPARRTDQRKVRRIPQST